MIFHPKEYFRGSLKCFACSVVIPAQEQDKASAVFMFSSKFLTPDRNGFTVSTIASVCVLTSATDLVVRDSPERFREKFMEVS